MRRNSAAAIFVALTALVPHAASAQGQTPLRLVVPFSAGGGTDVLARLIAAELTGRIKQNVVVVNQTGANGFIATQAVHNAPPDGNTLLVANVNQVIFPAVKRDLPFHVIDGFEPVTMLAAGPLVISASPKFPHKTVPELIAAAKKEPGKISYASSGGIGNISHLAGELLNTLAQIQMVHVPYRGGAPAITDVIAGVVPFTIATIASALPYYELKHLIPIAQTPKKRMSISSNIPTIAEQTGLDYDLTFWVGFIAPPKTPADRVAYLQKEIAAAAATPKVQEAIKVQGFEPRPSTSVEFTRQMRSEMKQWVDVAKAANVVPE